MSNYLFKNPVAPYSNVNGDYVNVDSSNWPGSFGSQQTSLEYGLPALRDNVSAANASRMAGGGRKTLRHKIKNIVTKYRMPRGRKVRTMRKRKLMSLYKRKGPSRKRGTRTRTRKQRGGYYNQFSNNIPNTPSFSTGGILSSKDLGLANPVPYQKLSNCTNCVDNYNYNTNKGFQFW